MQLINLDLRGVTSGTVAAVNCSDFYLSVKAITCIHATVHWGTACSSFFTLSIVTVPIFPVWPDPIHWKSPQKGNWEILVYSNNCREIASLPEHSCVLQLLIMVSAPPAHVSVPPFWAVEQLRVFCWVPDPQVSVQPVQLLQSPQRASTAPVHIPSLQSTPVSSLNPLHPLRISEEEQVRPRFIVPGPQDWEQAHWLQTLHVPGNTGREKILYLCFYLCLVCLAGWLTWPLGAVHPAGDGVGVGSGVEVGVAGGGRFQLTGTDGSVAVLRPRPKGTAAVSEKRSLVATDFVKIP